jgi:hypothetical protein
VQIDWRQQLGRQLVFHVPPTCARACAMRCVRSRPNRWGGFGCSAFYLYVRRPKQLGSVCIPEFVENLDGRNAVEGGREVGPQAAASTNRCERLLVVSSPSSAPMTQAPNDWLHPARETSGFHAARRRPIISSTPRHFETLLKAHHQDLTLLQPTPAPNNICPQELQENATSRGPAWFSGRRPGESAKPIPIAKYTNQPGSER